MTDLSQEKGSCLCGAVQINAKTVNKNLGACHCQMCRQWTGGPLLVLDCGSEIEFSGENNIRVYASSKWAERGFCYKCGTHLFYRVKKDNQFLIPVGIFKNIKNVIFEHQIFIDRKPSYYSFANETENLTEAQVFAQFNSLSD